jgi:pimeloyl-ACP methyl ester carboxylesterase
VHTWPRECHEINACGTSVDRYGAITVPTLMLLGTATALHHVQATEALSGVLPNGRVAELSGQGHGAVSAAPTVVAAELAQHCLGDRR